MRIVAVWCGEHRRLETPEEREEEMSKTNTIPEAWEKLGEAIADLVYMQVGAAQIRRCVDSEIERCLEVREESEINRGELSP